MTVGVHKINAELVDGLTEAVFLARSPEGRASVLVETLGVLAEAIEWCGVRVEDDEYAFVSELVRTAEAQRRRLSHDAALVSLHDLAS